MDNKTDAMKNLAAHALATLPDSRQAAMHLLGSVLTVLPRNDETRIAAQTQLHLLQQVDKFQAQLQLDYSGGQR